MSQEMTSRERVLTTLNHEEPDRIPLLLWGSYYTLNDEIYFSFAQIPEDGRSLAALQKIYVSKFKLL